MDRAIAVERRGRPAQKKVNTGGEAYSNNLIKIIVLKSI